MRRAMGEKEAWDFIDSIPVIDVKWIESDKSREQEYKNAMRSNDPRHLVGIIKNLYLRSRERENQGKKVTAVDDRYFKMAENALNSELAHALGKDKNDIRDLIAESIESKTRV
jgi:CarD family transcriptional regulator